MPPESASKGTKEKRANFRCLLSDVAIPGDYIKERGQAGEIGARLMAIVAEGDRGRVYLSPIAEHERTARSAGPTEWRPLGDVPARLTGGTCVPYGLDEWWKLYTERQLVALTTFCDLVSETREQVRRVAAAAGLPDDGVPLRNEGVGANAYADAVSVYLALGIGRQANRSATLNVWNTGGEKIEQVFARQAIPMTWDYPESNPLGTSSGNFMGQLEYTYKSLARTPATALPSYGYQADARSQERDSLHLISTDPPYFDNIGYADLSDFFYVWLRRALTTTMPDLFATLATPKDEELVATPHRHGSKEAAETFFLDGITRALEQGLKEGHPSYPISIYYAFKQSENNDDGVVSTGWEKFLAAVQSAGFKISSTWPVRTERSGGVKAGKNMLASCIVLNCSQRSDDSGTTTRREFQGRLRSEYPDDLGHLQRSNIAPVDLAQASIGPGMRIFTEYREVLNADGSAMTVREALALINATLDEVLAEQEGDFDPDTRWALTWFEQHGFEEGEFGDADTLSKAKGTSVEGVVQAGLAEARRGDVRLLRASELDEDWDPATDRRPTVWEMAHHLIRLLESEGESGAAELAAALGSQAETARDLAYRLYVVSDRMQRPADARQYNALVQSWPEIMRLAQLSSDTARQAGLEFAEE